MKAELARIFPDRVLSLEARRRWAEAETETEAGANSALGTVPVWLPVADADTEPHVSQVPLPVLRVAVLRAPGRVFRFLAADAAQQLREGGSIVVEPDVGPFVVDGAELGHRLPGQVFDLVLQIGSRVPAAVRLAAELGTPLLKLDTPWPMALAEVVKEALAGEADQQPLLEVSLDGTSMLTLGPVDVMEGSSQLRNHGEHDTPPRRVGRFRIEPADSAIGLQLWRDGHYQSSDGGVEIGGHGRVRLLIDGMEHVGGHAVVRPFPTKLRLLVPERCP